MDAGWILIAAAIAALCLFDMLNRDSRQNESRARVRRQDKVIKGTAVDLSANLPNDGIQMDGASGNIDSTGLITAVNLNITNTASIASLIVGQARFQNAVTLPSATITGELIVNGVLSINALLDATDGIATNAFQLTTGAGAAKVLTSDANGNGTWQTPSAGGGSVSSVAGDGTTVSVNQSTGAVIVSATGNFGAANIQTTGTVNAASLTLASLGAGSYSSQLMFQEVELQSSDILQLSTVSFPLLANTPPSGFSAAIISGQFAYLGSGHTPYQNGSNFVMQYGSGAGATGFSALASGFSVANTFIYATVNQWTPIAPNLSAAFAQGANNTDGLGIYLSCNTAFIVGTGLIKVKLYYVLQSTF